jgi:hypothetical protein
MSQQQTVEDEVLSLERRYWQSLQDKDVAGALALTDDPCLITGAQGVRLVDHESYAAMMGEAAWTIDRFDIADDAEVRVLGDDTAILAYTVREELTVDGAPVTVEAADASTWVRRGEHWVCALHSESPLGDPFGREER